MSIASWLAKINERMEDRVDKAFPATVPNEPDTDLKKPVRWGRRIFLVVAAAGFFWGAFAPLDQSGPLPAAVPFDPFSCRVRPRIQHALGTARQNQAIA